MVFVLGEGVKIFEIKRSLSWDWKVGVGSVKGEGYIFLGLVCICKGLEVSTSLVCFCVCGREVLVKCV